MTFDSSAVDFFGTLPVSLVALNVSKVVLSLPCVGVWGLSGRGVCWMFVRGEREG